MKDADVVAFVDRLLFELGIDAPEHIDVHLVAARHGVFARFRPLDDEEGHLVRSGTNGIVHIAERTRGGHKERFTFAHELGHWLLHPEMDAFVRCTGIGASDRRAQRREREANLFASSLLLPRSLFAPLCGDDRPTLHELSALSDRFRASLSATALAYVRHATAPCAVVCSRGGRVVWAKRSARFVADVAEGHTLGGAAFARLVFAGERPPDAMLPVDAGAWGLAGVELFEHARSIDGRDAALSFLWHAPGA